ncbi:PrgI family protein [Catellatospora sp. NPDC049609]|uniref:PrgI family protein n=1 Tax=Catellatospora sp. NPDC049609 TaxID=3155505 RepID=UPI003414E3D1
MRNDPDVVPVTRVPADVNTPDKIAYGLTARQLAILTVAAVAVYSTYRLLEGRTSSSTLLMIVTPLVGLSVAVAMGRRDGLPMDSWAGAALRYLRTPRQLAPAAGGSHLPPAAATCRHRRGRRRPKGCACPGYCGCPPAASASRASSTRALSPRCWWRARR